MFTDDKDKKKSKSGSGQTRGFGGLSGADVAAQIEAATLAAGGGGADLTALNAQIATLQAQADAATAAQAGNAADEADTDAEQAAQDQATADAATGAAAALAAAQAAQSAADTANGNVASLDQALSALSAQVAALPADDDSGLAADVAALQAQIDALPTDDDSVLQALADANAVSIAANAAALAANMALDEDEATALAASQLAQDERLDAVEAAIAAIPTDDDSALQTQLDELSATVAALPTDDDSELQSQVADLQAAVAALPTDDDSALQAQVDTLAAAVAALPTDDDSALQAQADALDVSQIEQDNRLTDLEDTRTIETITSVNVYVAVPGAANEQEGDFNSIPEALDELMKYRFTRTAKGIVNIRAGEHQITSTINMEHPQQQRIRIIGETVTDNNDVEWTGDLAADEAQFKTRFASILVLAGSANRVFNNTWLYGASEIYFLGFKNESTATTTYGIYAANYPHLVNVVRCGFIGFRHGIYSVDMSRVILLGADILHSELYAMYAVRGRIHTIGGANGKINIDTCTYAGYVIGINGIIEFTGVAANPNQVKRCSQFGLRAIYRGQIHIAQCDVDGCSTFLQGTHGAWIYSATCSLVNNTGRVMNMEAGSFAFLTTFDGPVDGTGIQQEVRAFDMSTIRRSTTVLNATFSPLKDVEGNFNSIIT